MITDSERLAQAVNLIEEIHDSLVQTGEIARCLNAWYGTVDARKQYKENVYASAVKMEMFLYGAKNDHRH